MVSLNKEKIMIIDDEKEINELIQSYLKKEGYDIYSAYDGRTALKMVSEVNPDLIILDVMLPDIDGKDLCFEIRKRTNCSILFLSCKSEELDKIIALSVGGDDYITKPFLPGELMARINAHLRRSRMANFNMPQNEVYHFPGLTVNIDNHEVFVDHQPVPLTAKEFEILSILVKNPKRVFSMEQLFQMVWKTESLDGDSNTIMVYISNLRRKLEINENNPKYIKNIRGVGYKFNGSIVK